MPLLELSLPGTSGIEVARGEQLDVVCGDHPGRGPVGALDVERDAEVDAGLYGLEEVPEIAGRACERRAERAERPAPLLAGLGDDGLEKLLVDPLELGEVLDEEDEFHVAGGKSPRGPRA